METQQWLVFVAVWTVASIPMGPNALNVVAVSAASGFARALWSITGIAIAGLCHMAASALGFAALLLASADLYLAIKLSGAAYLVWMGIGMWRNRGVETGIGRPTAQSPLALVYRAFLISMSNPKAIIAYLAVFSQFLGPGDDPAGEFTILAVTALAILIAVYGSYAALGSGVGRLIRSDRARRWFDRAVGSFYIAAGLGLAMADMRLAGSR